MFGKGVIAAIAVGVVAVIVLVLYGFHGPAQDSSGGFADSSSSATLAMLPHFGEPRGELQHRLAPYKIDYQPPDTTPPAYYRFRVGDDLLRLSFIYATRKDGSDVLSGVYIQHDNIEDGQVDLSADATTLSNESRLAVANAMLPDRKALSVSSLSDAEQSDASPPGKGEDSAFFASAAAGRHAVQNPYWDIPKQQWIADAACPAAKPNDVQVYTETIDGRLDEGGVFSEYLYECMKRSIQ